MKLAPTPPPPALRATSPVKGEDNDGDAAHPPPPSSSPFTGEVAAKRPEGDKATASYRKATLRDRARYMRKNMTHQETRLWLQLQAFNREYGLHFRRQAVIDNAIADFAEFRRRLIIEVDGAQHGEDDGRDRGQRRDQHFARTGFRTLRFWNFEIDRHMEGVCDVILEAAGVQRAPPPPPALRAASPVKGEDE